jgi:peptidoglycan/xylan/chitin deacetylase (PgdA/CDA1 family)
VHPTGWLGPSGGQSVAGVIRRALAALRPGEMILMHAGSNPHDGSTLDADALATIIRAIERRGYGFTTLPQAYATAFPSWAKGERRLQSRDGVSPALARFIRLGLPIYCGGRHGRTVALTFDDGPWPATAATLRLLRHYGERATFFLVGRNLAEWPRLPRLEAALGAVGDHTWTHPFLTRLPPRDVEREISTAQSAIERATAAPVELFRPPYGFHDATVDRDVRRLGMLQVLWSLDSRDSYPPPGANAAAIARTLAQSVRPGSIVLLHENLRQTQLALRTILRQLRSAGLTSVSIPELLEHDPPTLVELHAGIRGCSDANT